MKFDISQELKDFRGNSIKETPAPDSINVTLGTALVMAILQSDSKDGAEKLKDYRLLQKMTNTEADLNPEEIIRLLALCSKSHSVPVYGVVYDLLNR